LNIYTVRKTYRHIV